MQSGTRILVNGHPAKITGQSFLVEYDEQPGVEIQYDVGTDGRMYEVFGCDKDVVSTVVEADEDGVEFAVLANQPEVQSFQVEVYNGAKTRIHAQRFDAVSSDDVSQEFNRCYPGANVIVTTPNPVDSTAAECVRAASDRLEQVEELETVACAKCGELFPEGMVTLGQALPLCEECGTPIQMLARFIIDAVKGHADADLVAQKVTPFDDGYEKGFTIENELGRWAISIEFDPS